MGILHVGCLALCFIYIHYYATTSAAGSDFKALEKYISCGEVEDEYCFDIAIEDDHIAEDDESFVVSISGLGMCMSSKLQQAMVVIMDNDQSQAQQQPSSSGGSRRGESSLSQQPQKEKDDCGMFSKLPPINSK